MRAVVTGGSGTVGWAVLNQLAADHELSYTYLDNDVVHPLATGHHLDIRDRTSVFDYICDLCPDVIIHSAAMTDVDACETHPQQAHDINVKGTKNILDAAVDVDASVVFLSTAFVFDGKKDQYKPMDDRNPINEYGRTKYNAERAVTTSNLDTAILRTDQPYGCIKPWQSQTMIQWTLDQLSTDEPIHVFEDWYNNPTYLPDLAKVAKTIIEGAHTGTFHAVGPDYINRCSWAKSIAAEFGYDTSRIVSSRSESADLPAERPNVNLDNMSMTTSLGLSMTDLNSGLKETSKI